MHSIENKLIELGIIDTPIESIQIDEWYENMTLMYMGEHMKRVCCKFLNCYEISLKHDRTYSKGKTANGSPDFKYFVQDVKITEEQDFILVSISAWPLCARIVCRECEISVS